MFRKPAKIKSQTNLRNSDRRKLRADILAQFPSASSDVEDIFSSKDDFSVSKLTTFQGDSAQVFFRGANPFFFELEGVYFPTVYVLWAHPLLTHAFTTWAPVFSKLQDGADLMLPGVVAGKREELTAEKLGNLKEGQICAVKVVGNRSAVAVGRTTMSSADMLGAGMRGKGVNIVHTYKDHLWALGTKAELPSVVDSDALLLAGSDEEEVEETVTNAAGSTGVTDTSDSGARDAPDHAGDGVTALTTAVDKCTIRDTDDATCDSSATITQSEKSPKEEMDALLTYCLLCALKTKVKASHLPVSSSDLYTLYMKPCCPRSKVMDVKKSSYKKLSRFLAAMRKQNVLEVKDVSDDVTMVTAINWTNPLIKTLEVQPDVGDEDDVDEGQGHDTAVAVGGVYRGPPDIVEVFLVNAAVLPIFRLFGHQKGAALTGQEVRNCVSQYVKDRQLQDEHNKSQVSLDDTLSRSLAGQGQGREALMRWDEMFSRLFSVMTVGYTVTFPGDSKPLLRRGKLQPITLNVVQRAANKKVTVVSNLDTYGIDPSEFAKVMQHSAACSTSVVKGQGNETGTVQVQGNQIHIVADLLQDKYGIAVKHICGLEKAPKPKRS